MKKIVVTTLLFALLFAGEALAWGKVGHKTVALIAERNLTPKAKAEIEKYTKGESLGEYGSWMDIVRREDPRLAKATAGLHATIADTNCKSPVEVRAKYRKGRDGVTAMEEFRRTLGSKKLRAELPDSAVLDAIKCMVHIVGDFHCPAHVRFTDYENQCKFPVTFFKKETTLHKVWDAQLISRGHKGWKAEQYAEYLDTWTKAEQKKCTRGWAKEWFEDAARDIRPIMHETQEGAVLGKEFVEKYTPLCDKEIRKAGYQLAAALNTIFGK